MRVDLLDPVQQRQRDMEALERHGSAALRAAVAADPEAHFSNPDFLSLLRSADFPPSPGRIDNGSWSLRMWGSSAHEAMLQRHGGRYRDIVTPPPPTPRSTLLGSL